MNGTGPHVCPECGATLQTPDGRCSTCLLALGLDEPGTEAAAPGEPERFRILRTLGEGGMGTVYLAEQTEPVRRRVALKVIKRGMDSREVLRRFDGERQALALMDHPCIARVFEAGETPSGQPFFSMEYVDGTHITDYADGAKLSIRERLSLFRTLCDGVQHAHQKGIIHRDLKPSNILVTGDGDPVPKIIDFGIAKAMDHTPSADTFVTELGVVVGTPQYMSPEQAEMSALGVDTRSDIYSLGVVLYELLSGCLPFDTKDAGLTEIRRQIRETEPPTPSACVRRRDAGAIAHRRGADPLRLRRQLEGDLDWITMKALEKDPARRYPSVAEFSADIQRYLGNEPVLARPPSTVYRLRKFVRRHRLGAGTSAVALTVLVGFSVVMTVQAGRIARERDRSERVAGFLGQMLREVQPDAMGAAILTDLAERIEAVHRRRGADDAEIARVLEEFRGSIEGVNPTQAARALLDHQILSSAGSSVGEELGADPLLAARLWYTIGNTYLELGLPRRAGPYLRDAWDLRLAHLGSTHPDTLQSTESLGALHAARGELWDAEQRYREALEGYRRVLGGDAVATLACLSHLGVLLRDLGKTEEAESVLRETIGGMQRIHGADHPDTVAATDSLATVLVRQDRYDEAEELHRDALERYRRLRGPHHPETLRSLHHLALLLFNRAEYEEAEMLLAGALEEMRRARGDDHPETLALMATLGTGLRLQGRTDEAEALIRESLEGRRRVLGEDHPETLDSLQSLGAVFYDRGQEEVALRYEEQVLEGRRRVLGEEHPTTLTSIANMGVVLWKRGRYEEAEEHLREALQGRIRVLGPDNSETLVARNNLATLLWTTGHLAQAEEHSRAALEGYRRVLGEDHPTATALLNNLALLLQDRGKLAEAEDRFREALAIHRRAESPDRNWVCALLAMIGDNLNRQQRFDEAEGLLRESLKLHRAIYEEGNWLIANTSSYLGESLVGQRRFAEAEPLLVGAADMEVPPYQARYRNDALARIVALYDAWGKPAEAAAWKERLPPTSE